MISNTLRDLAPILSQHVKGQEILRILAYWDRHADHYEHETAGPLNVDIAEAIYWIGANWHGGKRCSLYSAMCVCGFSPSTLADGVEAGGTAEMIYAELETILESL